MLDRIDRVIDGLCPCGAPPRDGSAYCGDDCTPTHIARHTDTSQPGEHGAQSTPMRWRPDLVTETDDTGLIPLDAAHTGYAGPHHAQIFQRDATTWHLRLDDGHRYVGADLHDVPQEPILDAEFVARVMAKWSALERELGNTRHLDPWADVVSSWHRAIDAWNRAAADADEALSERYRAEHVLAGGTDPRVEGTVFIAPTGTDPGQRSEWAVLGTMVNDGLCIDWAAEYRAAVQSAIRTAGS